jgi:hypothetical protein
MMNRKVKGLRVAVAYSEVDSLLNVDEIIIKEVKI